MLVTKRFLERAAKGFADSEKLENRVLQQGCPRGKYEGEIIFWTTVKKFSEYRIVCHFR